MNRIKLYNDEIDKELKYIRNSYIKISSYLGKLQNPRVMQNEKILTDEEVNEIVDKIMMKNKLVGRLFIKKRKMILLES